jgi:Phosphotransferase enzyme family
MSEQRLPGGRSFGAVRVGDEVRRPAQPWTATVHTVLRHLEDVGFGDAPKALGFDDQGRERLTFLPGQTLGETSPWPDWLRGDDALLQVGAWLRRLHDATATFRPAADAVWFTGRSWQPGLLIAHLDASPWNAVWTDGALVGFVDWDTASPSRREDDLAFSALTWVPLLTVQLAEQVGFADPADRHRRLHLLLDAYGYGDDRAAIRDAIIGRVQRNVAMIRQLAGGGEPTFQRLLPWAADLERSGTEVAELPAEFWQRPVLTATSTRS